MKKILGTVLSAGAALFLLTSCGSNPQDEFVSYMEKQSKQTEGTWDFKVGIKEFEMPTTSDTTANPMVGMLTTQLKDAKITGTIKSKTKDEVAFDADLKINALGMEVPFRILGDYGTEPKIYLAADIMESVMGIVDSMTGSNSTSENDYASVKGKFIDVLAMDETMDQTYLEDLTKEMDEAQKNNAELQKKMTDYLKGLDKKSFTKKGSVVSHTFTKAEFIELTKTLSDEIDTKDVDLNEAFNALGDVSMAIDLDTKKDRTTMTFTIAPNEADAETAGFKSITVISEVTLTDKKANITLPKEADILTNEEVEKIFPSAASPTALGAQTLTDEDFQDMKQAFAATKDSYDEATKKEILEMYKAALTEEQYKELEEILK